MSPPIRRATQTLAGTDFSRRMAGDDHGDLDDL